MSELSQETMQLVADGEMKLVESTVLLLVPSSMPLETVERNIDAGVSFIIEEHLFFIEDDNYEKTEDNVAEDVELVKITSNVVSMKGSE